MNQSSNWVAVLSALLTPLIAIIASYVAYQQHRTNRLKLKHDLFERRYAIFDTLMKFLGSAMREGKTSFQACILFLGDTSQAQFLFGPEIPQYLRVVYEKGLDLSRTHDKLHGEEHLPVGDERTRIANENSNLLGWFTEQAPAAQEL